MISACLAFNLTDHSIYLIQRVVKPSKDTFQSTGFKRVAGKPSTDTFSSPGFKRQAETDTFVSPGTKRSEESTDTFVNGGAKVRALGVFLFVAGAD